MLLADGIGIDAFSLRLRFGVLVSLEIHGIPTTTWQMIWSLKLKRRLMRNCAI